METDAMIPVGAIVEFRLASKWVRAKVIEYRGPLAAGEDLYRVETLGEFPQAYELPESEYRVVEEMKA